jgi:hypothetical protein
MMPETLTITRDWFAMLESLPTVQSRWNVLYAVAGFAFDGVKPDGLDALEKAVFMNIKSTISSRKRWNRFYSKHKDKCRNQTFESNGSKTELKRLNQTFESNAVEQTEFSFNTVDSHGNLKKDNTLDSSRDIKENRVKESQEPKRKIFVPPTLDDVIAYARERNSPADPEEFFNYHSANGWMIGRTKMRDWKRAFQYWERKEYNRARRRNSPPPRDYSGI